MQKLYALGVGHTGNFYHFFIQAIFILSQTPWLVDPNCANKLSTRFKAPYTSSEYKVLDVISKTLTFARNLAFWGAVWGPVHNLHPLWQGKSTFLNLPQSTSASGYKHYKCQHCCNVDLGQGYWECWRMGGTHTRDTGKKAEMSLHTCCEFQPGFCSQSCEVHY
jgi:hypothetical protein